MQRQNDTQPPEVHIIDNYYLTADKYQFIIFRKETTQTGKLTKKENVGKIKKVHPRYFPSLQQVFQYIFSSMIKDKIMENKLKEFKELKKVFIVSRKTIEKAIDKNINQLKILSSEKEKKGR